MDKVFIFNLPEIAQKLQADYEVISGNSFKDTARKASPPLTDALAFSIIKNQETYGFPADKWVKLAVEKLGPVLIVGQGSLDGTSGATYCDSEEEIHGALSEMGIEVDALKPSEDFSGLFVAEDNFALPGIDEQAGVPDSSAGVADATPGSNEVEQEPTPATGFELPGVDTPETAPATGFDLPGIGTPGSVSSEAPTTTLPVTQPELSPLPAPEGSAMPGSVAPAGSQSSFGLPGVNDVPAPAQVPTQSGYDLSPNTAPGSSAGLDEQETSQSGYDLPGVDATPGSNEVYATPDPSSLPGQTGFELPGVNQAPAPAPSPASFELPTDAIPFSSPTPQGNLYDDIDLSLPEVEPATPGAGISEQYEAPEPAPKWDREPDSEPESVPSWEEAPVEPSWRSVDSGQAPAPGSKPAPSWGEAPGSKPAPSWEEHPVETNWQPTSQANEPVRPAPGPPIAPAAIAHTTNGGCPTIIVFGAKGGVGKTTTSIHLAQRAGKLCPDMRITLIDANRGQGDIRTKLRTLNVPTIFDALPEGGRGAIITPPALDKDRPPHLEPLAFALIAAPPSELSDPTQVTPEVYQNALSEARSVSDLVIVDTQISEKYDTTKLFENFLIPLLIKDENIWGVGATEDSPESINNLLERLHQYRARGVKAAKIFTLIAQAHAHNTPEDLRDFEEMFDQASTFAGAVPYNKTIYNRLSSGILCESLPPVAEPLDRILYAVTGNRVFVAKKEPETKKKTHRSRFGKSKKRRR